MNGNLCAGVASRQTSEGYGSLAAFCACGSCHISPNQKNGVRRSKSKIAVPENDVAPLARGEFEFEEHP